MLRWIWRLSASGLKSDLRWLLPVMVCTSLALGAFLPVFGILQTVRSGAQQYLRRTLGADVRVTLSDVPALGEAQQLATLVSLLPEGTRCVVGRATTATVAACVASPELVTPPPATATVLVLDEPGYPFYGGNLWTRLPGEALETGLVLTVGLAEVLEVRPGDSVVLFNRILTVAALSPDNLLTIADTSTEGQVIVLRSAIQPAGVNSDWRSESVFAFLALSSGTDRQDAEDLTQCLVDSFGRNFVLGLGDMAPLVTSGLERLSAVFFWASLIVLFICAFGIAFGLEDYARSHSLETAVFRSFGASPSQVVLILAGRLILVGLATGALTSTIAFLLREPLGSLFGFLAKDMVDLALPRAVSWPLVFMGPVLIVVYGLYAFWITMGVKPFAVLRQKTAGFPLLGRSEQSAWSVFAVVLVTLSLVPLLQRLLLGSGAPSLTPAWCVLGLCLALFVIVYLVMTLIERLGRSAPAGIRWALTYVRLGRARSIVVMTAVTIALSVGVGAVLLDRALTSELEGAIKRQIPASTLAYYPAEALTRDGQADLVQRISALDTVTAAAGGGLAVVRVMSTSAAGGDGTAPMGTLVVKLVDPDHGGLFGSTLTQELLEQGGCEPDEIPCSLVEEYATKFGLSVGDTIDVRPAMKAGEVERLRVVAIEPYIGLRIGLLAVASVPDPQLPADFGVIVAKGEPSRGRDIAAMIERLVPGSRVYDLGAFELLLRSISRQLAFLWWMCALLSLLVTLAVCFSAASISRIRRTAELALFRALGASPQQIRAGPATEALTQGLLCGFTAGGLVQIAILKGIGFIFGIQVPLDAALLTACVAASLLIAVVMQLISVRRSLRLSPLEVLRND